VNIDSNFRMNGKHPKKNVFEPGMGGIFIARGKTPGKENKRMKQSARQCRKGVQPIFGRNSNCDIITRKINNK